MAKAKTKTKRKKPISTTRSAVVFTVLALMCVLYFYYLSNRGASVENINSSTNDTELSTLLNKNIDAAYPESPKEVVKLYARYTKQFYKDGLTDDQVSKLGNQARILFDAELKAPQTDSQYIESLKAEIADYKSNNRYVAAFLIDESENVKYKQFQGKSYAMVNVVYNVREGSNLITSVTRYTLRKDDASARWKILFWENLGGNKKED
jgi:hypothetical protein